MGWFSRFLFGKAQVRDPVLTLTALSVESVAYSLDGSRLAAGCARDPHLLVWDAQSGTVSLSLKFPLQVWSVAFSPDGARILTGHGAHGSPGEARVIDSATGRELVTLTGHRSNVSAVAYSPNGRRLATAGKDDVVRIWDAVTGRERLMLDPDMYEVTSLAFSPDGTLIAAAGGREYEFGRVRIWKTSNGRLVHTIKGRTRCGPVLLGRADMFVLCGVAFSPDAARIAIATKDNGAELYDAKTGEKIKTLGGHSSSVTCVAFSPGGKFMVTGSLDNTLKLWDAESGECLLTIEAHRGHEFVSAVAFSPDGRRLVSGGGDWNTGAVKVWELPTSLRDPKSAALLPPSGEGSSAGDVERAAVYTHFQCSVCGRRLKALRRLVGQSVRCPCGLSVTIPPIAAE